VTAIRKVVVTTEDLILEQGQPVSAPVRRAAVAAVIGNPWAGQGMVADLQPQVADVAGALAAELAGRLITVLGGVESVEAFGKAAIVGLDGEIEHGAALIHTPYFGNVIRQLVNGESIIVFADERSAAGAALSVPVWHKNASATRSHYQTVQVRVSDAPRPDEIVVVVAGASGPRPNARIGDRTTDRDVPLVATYGGAV
jgi:hypothetical protein